MNEAQTILLSVDDLDALVRAALRRGGLGDANTGAVAATIVASERDGVRSHGILRLPAITHSLRTGWVDGTAIPTTLNQAASMMVVDARNGFAQNALASARSHLIAMARTTGAAILLIRDSHHYAALWPDIEGFAREGLAALTCVNSKKRMAAWGGTRPVTGTNAVAFAAPRSSSPPLVWDQSSSVLSQGDVLLAAREGRDVEPGVGCDNQGRPTVSAAAILEGGALLPFGGHKGASIAIMVEILAAALTGSMLGCQDTSIDASASTSKGGQFLLLIDPERSGNAFAARVETLMDAVLAAGATRLPGDRRYRHRAMSEKDGVQLPTAAYASLLEMAGRG